MKSLMALVLLAGIQAVAYNTTYVPVQFGKHNQVETRTKALFNSKVISLKFDLNTKVGAYPVVQISDQDQKNCAHTKTLILFSGYDAAAKLHKRTYEVQIQRNPSENCYLTISASTSSQDKTSAARVSIWPSR